METQISIRKKKKVKLSKRIRHFFSLKHWRNFFNKRRLSKRERSKSQPVEPATPFVRNSTNRKTLPPNLLRREGYDDISKSITKDPTGQLGRQSGLVSVLKQIPEKTEIGDELIGAESREASSENVRIVGEVLKSRKEELIYDSDRINNNWTSENNINHNVTEQQSDKFTEISEDEGSALAKSNESVYENCIDANGNVVEDGHDEVQEYYEEEGDFSEPNAPDSSENETDSEKGHFESDLDEILEQDEQNAKITEDSSKSQESEHSSTEDEEGYLENDSVIENNEYSEMGKKISFDDDSFSDIGNEDKAKTDEENSDQSENSDVEITETELPAAQPVEYENQECYCNYIQDDSFSDIENEDKAKTDEESSENPDVTVEKVKYETQDDNLHDIKTDNTFSGDKNRADWLRNNCLLEQNNEYSPKIENGMNETDEQKELDHDNEEASDDSCEYNYVDSDVSTSDQSSAEEIGTENFNTVKEFAEEEEQGHVNDSSARQVLGYDEKELGTAENHRKEEEKSLNNDNLEKGSENNYLIADISPPHIVEYNVDIAENDNDSMDNETKTVELLGARQSDSIAEDTQNKEETTTNQLSDHLGTNLNETETDSDTVELREGEISVSKTIKYRLLFLILFLFFNVTNFIVFIIILNIVNFLFKD